MDGPLRLPAAEILAAPPEPPPGLEIGRSRGGRPLYGWRFGDGGAAVSLIAGCHADEPVGPAMLAQLASFLAARPSDHPLLARATWRIVPNANPDGAARNAAWSRTLRSLTDSRGRPDSGYDLSAYLRHVVREAPGDDVEFGFPRGPEDREARPENRAVAAFLAAGGPYRLHASFHGMSLAPGPWFLIEPRWVGRTGALRDFLRQRVRSMGYSLYDPDRGGEKGFRRIDEGFSTRPDSVAMAVHFRRRGDAATADLFRPSSMELARSLGGDPFTFVSEMPLFLLPTEDRLPFSIAGSEGRRRLHAWLGGKLSKQGPARFREEIAELGIRPMPIRDQMRLQLAFLDQGLAAVNAGLEKEIEKS